MLIDPAEILKAKQQLGERNADIIAELLHVEKYNGQRHTCCCPSPTHDDSTPSCSYNPKTYSYKCFGCGYTVDIVDAYMQSLGCSFIEACERLFEEAKIPYDFTEKGVCAKSDYRYPKPVYAENNEKVYEYWGQRHISHETLDYLGVRQDAAGNTLFQYWDLNDVLAMVKVRKSAKVKHGETKIWCLPGSDTQFLLYNCSKINPEQPLILCTGEGDCATAIECGFKNSVSVPLGDGNTQWIAENWDWLQQFKEIILVHDNDESGNKFAKDVAIRLGEYRTKIVDIPKATEPIDGTRYKIKDLNELLYYNGKDAVVKVLNEAKNAEIETLIDYSDVSAFNMADVDGFTSGFQELDSAIDKFYCGTTTILTGVAGAGKSSLISTLVCQALDQNFPAFVYSGELSNQSLKNWIASVHAGQRGINKYESAENNFYYKIRSDVSKKIDNYYRGKLFFYKDGFAHKTSKLFSTMESAVRIHGVKFIVLDNMTSIDTEAKDDGSDKWTKQDAFIRDIIDFSKKWNVVCLVVLHPKKLDCLRRMSIFDLQGVVSAVNLSHRVLALYRVSPKEKEGIFNKRGDVIQNPINYDVLLDVLKDRFGSGANKTIGLYYDIPSRRFFDSYNNLDHKYNWDTNDYKDMPLPYGVPQLEEENEVLGPPVRYLS